MILARHAEALFWAGRQLERAEHTARVLDVMARNAMHFLPGRAAVEWRRVLHILGLAVAFDAAGRRVDARNVTDYVFADPTNPGAVRASVEQLRENVRTVRDRVPVELWETANLLHIELRGTNVAELLSAEPFELTSRVRHGCQTVTGVVTEAMPRDEGYAFMQVGRMLERSTLLVRLIRHGLLGAGEDAEPAAILRMASSLQAFRRDHGYDDRPPVIAGFLLATESVPRSLLSCLRQTERRLEPLIEMAPGVQPARRIAGRLRSRLEFGDLGDELADADAFLLDLEIELTKLAAVIRVHAFDPALTTVTHSQFIRPGTEDFEEVDR